MDWHYGEVRVSLSNTRWRVALPEEPTLGWYTALVLPVALPGGSCDNGGNNAYECSVDCGDRGCSVGCSNGATACCSCGWTGPRCYCQNPA